MTISNNKNIKPPQTSRREDNNNNRTTKTRETMPRTEYTYHYAKCNENDLLKPDEPVVQERQQISHHETFFPDWLLTFCFS
mmetsp:Transcript_14671/g.33935  ORF Transcript_14671/g.33935 Transcript_14671/m.33935 type:complete len:81 (-) Transcript_14671:692-934(-)